MKILIILYLAVILSISISNAYPAIISNPNTNHSFNIETVYSVPEKYYRYVDKIEFVNYSIKDYENGYIGGYAYAWWNIHHNCYNGYITLSSELKNLSRDALTHELGHIYELCELKRDITTEDFANSFRIYS